MPAVDDEQFPHLVAPPLIVDVDVRDLVIDDRKRRARARVEDLESQLLPHGNHSHLSQHAVDVDRRRDARTMPYSESTTVAYAPAFVELDQLVDHGVYRPQIVSHARDDGSEFLQVVVQVREVDERQRRALLLLDLLRGLRDPAGGIDRRPRTPELEERERSELCLKLVPQRTGEV